MHLSTLHLKAAEKEHAMEIKIRINRLFLVGSILLTFYSHSTETDEDHCRINPNWQRLQPWMGLFPISNTEARLKLCCCCDIKLHFGAAEGLSKITERQMKANFDLNEDGKCSSRGQNSLDIPFLKTH